MKANFGLLPPLENSHLHGKRERSGANAQRAMADLNSYLIAMGIP